MKNFQLLAFGLLLVFLTSCRDNTENVKEQVIGQWELVDVTMDSDVTLIAGPTTIEMTQEGRNNGSKMTLSVEENKTFSMIGNLKLIVDNYVDEVLVSTEEMDLEELGADFECESDPWHIDEEDQFVMEGLVASDIVLQKDVMTISMSNMLEEIPLSPTSTMDIDLDVLMTFEKQ